MAEIVRGKERKNIVDLEKKDKQKTENKKITEKKTVKPKSVPKEEKKSLWEKFIIFCHGVGNETKKIRWTSKLDLLKYSIATIIFILFCSIFFYGIDTIFAFIQSLFN